ncbi:hypothetical protein [Cryptosporangium minutisporangium]
MWTAFARAGETADYQSPDLPRYATGQALQTLVDGLKSNKQKGYVYRGRPTLKPRVTALSTTSSPNTASIVDCADTTTWRTYDKTGHPSVPEARGRHITASVTKQNGTWKVSTFAVQLADTC